MSLQSRLGLLITAIGADVKALTARPIVRVWKTGDATPPTSPLPTADLWMIKLSTTDTVPSWVPTGSLILRS